MTTNARLNKAQNFMLLSPSYRKETDPKVLEAREIIISWATPDFKIHNSRFPEISKELIDKNVHHPWELLSSH